MGICIDIGNMQEDILPDCTKPLTFESLVDQYREQAEKACLEKSWPQTSWRMLAEIWAGTDLDILQMLQAQNPGLSLKEILELKV